MVEHIQQQAGQVPVELIDSLFREVAVGIVVMQGQGVAQTHHQRQRIIGLLLKTDAIKAQL